MFRGPNGLQVQLSQLQFVDWQFSTTAWYDVEKKWDVFQMFKTSCVGFFLYSVKFFLEILILLARISCVYDMSFFYCSIQIYYAY